MATKEEKINTEFEEFAAEYKKMRAGEIKKETFDADYASSDVISDVTGKLLTTITGAKTVPSIVVAEDKKTVTAVFAKQKSGSLDLFRMPGYEKYWISAQTMSQVQEKAINADVKRVLDSFNGGIKFVLSSVLTSKGAPETKNKALRGMKGGELIECHVYNGDLKKYNYVGHLRLIDFGTVEFEFNGGTVVQEVFYFS